MVRIQSPREWGGKGIDPSIAERLNREFLRYPSRTYPKGQIILFANDSPANLFFIAKGRVRRYELSYRGHEIIILTLKRSACFPTSWSVNQVTNQYFYKAETETTLHIIPSEDYLRFLQANPDILMYLFAQMHFVLDETYGRMMHLMVGTAQSRLVYELLLECRHVSGQEIDGSHILGVKEVDLAARAGLSRETVSREIKHLKDRGWIVLANGTIIVRDTVALEQALKPILPH